MFHKRKSRNIFWRNIILSAARKQDFFRAFGFDESNSHLLEAELLNLALTVEVTQVKEVERGTKYVLIGSIRTPIGRVVTIATIWMIERNQTSPRFVTAYPA